MLREHGARQYDEKDKEDVKEWNGDDLFDCCVCSGYDLFGRKSASLLACFHISSGRL
jgi:hypothetical protein